MEREVIKHIVRLDAPTLSQSGATMWHFFLVFRLTAIQSGTLALLGGLKGPYVPYPILALAYLEPSTKPRIPK